MQKEKRTFRIITKHSSLSQIKRREEIAAYIFISPYLISAIVFTVGLLAFALYISLSKWNIFTPPRYIGLKNYLAIFKSKEFIRALFNIFWYSLIVVTFQTVIAIFMATLLNKPIPGSSFFRTFFYAPSVTSSVVISMIFWWLYLKTGFLNLAIGKILLLFHIHWKNIDWLNDPRGIFQLIAGVFGKQIKFSEWYFTGPSITWMAIMFQAIYTTSPTFMIMFLAALQNIPTSLYESASIDGASQWTQFIKITLPLLRPVIMMVVVLGTIGTLQLFDYVKIMTAGGPLGTTMVPVYLIYRETLGTEGPIRAGYGAAMAFVLAAIIFIFTYIQRRFIEKGTEQYY